MYLLIYIGCVGKTFLKAKLKKKALSKNRRTLFPIKKGIGKKLTFGPDEHYGLAEPLVDEFTENDIESKKTDIFKFPCS